MEACVGTSGYGYREWKGKFYPEKIAAGDMLRFYAKHFSTVEINNTFYRMPGENVLKSWSEQVPGDFLFSVKAPQVITHLKRLRNVAAETDYFFRILPVVGKKLGPVLFQFPKSFRVDHAALEDFLNLVPVGFACAFDFRSPSWLESQTMNALRKRGFGLCIEDTDEGPAREILSTATWGYLRLRRSDYTDDDLMQWAKRVFSQKWERAFVYFKHEEEAKGPELALRFKQHVDSPAAKKRAAFGISR